MNYTRKRALLACDFCRHRKRRCDGERPCSTCRESNADCHYKDLPIERVESPSTPNEAVVERLGRIEALLEEQSQKLERLYLRGLPSSNFDEPHLSLSSNVSIDASATGAEPSEVTDANISSTGSLPVPRLPMHLAPEFAAHATTSHGGITATRASGASSTSPPMLAPVPSSIRVSPLGGIDVLNRPQYLYQQQQPQLQSQHPQTFLQHAPIAFHSASTVSSTPAAMPVFGYSTDTSAFSSGTGLSTAVTTTTTNASRALLAGTSPIVATSDGSSHNIEQDQQFLIPYEHSTAANTLLSLPLVRFFLTYQQQRSKINKPIRKLSGDNGSRESPTRPFFYTRTHFFDLESSQPLPPQLDLVFSPGVVPVILPQAVLAASHPSVLDSLAHKYFTYVHPSAPLFSATQFRQWSSKVYESGPDDSIGTAICLVVWALGSLAAPSSPSQSSTSASSPDPDQVKQRNNQNERDGFALSLFQPALKIILRHALWEFGPASLDTCQALLLGASYFSHTGRPLHNARFVYLAGRHLVRLIEEHKRDGYEPEEDGHILLVFWVCFIWECDRSAELDVPRSGIEPLAENMPLPSSHDPNDGNDMICFVAEIAARRLLNRIHSSLYAKGGYDSAQESLAIPDNDSATGGRTTPGNKRKRDEVDINASMAASRPGIGFGLGLDPSNAHNTDIVKMLPISAELNRQLEAWYQAMPEHIRPSLDDDNNGRRSNSGTAGSDLSFTDDLNEGVSPWPDSRQRHTSKPVYERSQILRIHYFAARHIIHRPFVLAAAWQQQQQILASERLGGGNREGADAGGRSVANEASNSTTPPLPSVLAPIPPLPTAILEKCAICVDSCAAYLVYVLPLLERRSPYLWSFCQSSMACLLVLLVADACPSIAASRPLSSQLRAQTMDTGYLRDQIASRLRRWSIPGSSFEAELRIVESLPVGPSQVPGSS